MKILLLAPLALVLVQLGQAPLQQQQQQRPLGSLEGTVTRLGTGQPVPNAQLRLTRRGGPVQAPVATGPAQIALPPGQAFQGGARGLPPVAPVMTDDRGKFTFSGLDEGTYILQALANGYVIQPYGQRFPNGPGTPITVTGGQTTKDININLTPAANISGRLRDTNETPLINVPVQLLRYSYDSTGNRTYQSVGVTQTNDRGEYRMYWVTPGRYYVLAGRPTTGSNPLSALYMADLSAIKANGNEVPAVTGYAFYPGVAEISNAQTIDLQPGADLQTVDLVFSSKPKTYSIRGKVIDSRTGQPPPRANVVVATQTPGLSSTGIDELMGPGSNYTAATGTFEITGLMPGNYTVVAMVMDAPVPGRGGPPGRSSGSLPVAVANADVDGVSVAVVPAGSIPGRLRVEGQLPQGLTLDRVRLRLVPVGAASAPLAGGPGGTGMVQISPDGTFRLNSVMPGDYRVEMLPLNPAFLKDVRFDGADALNTPIRFSGMTNNGLDVVLAVGGGRVEGTVTDARSQALPSVRVVLIPDRARYRSDLFKTTTTDQNGRFTLTGVSSGDYKVFAWESIEEFGWFDPDVLSRAENRGRAVHVTETSNETTDVRIIPAEASR
jgi:hypothetical protein